MLLVLPCMGHCAWLVLTLIRFDVSRYQFFPSGCPTLFQILASFSRTYHDICEFDSRFDFLVYSRVSFCSHLAWRSVVGVAQFGPIDFRISFRELRLLLLLMMKPSSSYAIIVSDSSTSNALSIFWGNNIGTSGIFVTSFRNGIFFRASYFPRARSTLFVHLSVCIRSMLMIPLQGDTTIKGDYITAGIVSCFATRIFACLCDLRIDALCNSMFDTLNSSQSLPKIGVGAEGIGTIFLSMQKILLMPLSIYVVWNKMLTANFSTAPNHLRTCRGPKFTINEIVPCTLVDSMRAVQGLGASRRLMRNFQCNLS